MAVNMFAVVADARSLFELGSATFDVTYEGISLCMHIHMLRQVLLLRKFAVTFITLVSFQTKVVCLNVSFQAKLR